MVLPLLTAYDAQLRTDAETPGAVSVTRLGPLRLVTFVGGRGLVTYRDLGGAAVDAIRRLVAEGLSHFRVDPGISRVEWKARGHDSAVGLPEALLESGFIPGEEESIMVGEARLLAVEVPLPQGVVLAQGVVLGQVTEQTDVRAMSAMHDEPSANRCRNSARKRYCTSCLCGTGWSCGWRGLRGRWSLPGGWNRYRAAISPGSGEAQRARSGAAAGYTAP